MTRNETRRERRRKERERALGRKLRDRIPAALPVPPDPSLREVEVLYAKRYERNFDEGEAVAWLIARPEWEDTIGAECDVVELERPRKGPKPSYTTRELEAALFFQVMCGSRSWKDARKELAGDDGERARVALGYDVPRETRCPQEMTRFAGVPSEATMCRHRKRFPWERRLQAYKRYFFVLRILNAHDPKLREGLRILGLDGTAQPTSLTCPTFNPDTGEIVNADSVTCWEGGYRVKRNEKVHGFGVLPLHCIHGLPWAYDHDRINTAENLAALKVIEDFRDNVRPHTGPIRAGVFTADTGFHDQVLRPVLQDMALVPNIHSVSHAEKRVTTQVEKADAEALERDLEGKPGWYADGLRELHHRCGNPVHTYRRVEQVGERVVTRLEAECKHCKSTVTVTAGQWKLVKDPTRTKAHADDPDDPRGYDKYVKVHPRDPDSVREWELGNPLTYNDTLAERYGSLRFGHGEGFNGSAVRRFKLFKTKGFYRTKAQAELHCVMVFAAMHGLTHRRRELEAAGEFDYVPKPPEAESKPSPSARGTSLPLAA